MALSFRLTGFLAVMLAWSTSHAQQINVVNQGMRIVIGQGTSLTINGNYTDNSGIANPLNPDDNAITLDEPIFLSGTLNISGDITNNSSTNTKLIYEFEGDSLTGTVVLNGALNQSIGGGNDSYFPRLTISKPGSVILNRNIEIDSALTFTQGVVDLNNHVLKLGINGSIAKENEVRKIIGTAGSVVTTAYELSPPSDESNYRGVGIGYSVSSQNFVGVVWTRYYQPGNFSVANGSNILRAYSMQTTSAGTFPSLTFHFDDADLNAFIADPTLALYFSNDNGVSWTKASSVVSAAERTVTATNVAVASDVVNIFTLAAATCNTLPSATISSVAPAVAGGVVNICDNESLQLSVLDVGTNDYMWTTPVSPSTNSAYPAFNVDYDATPTHSGVYSVFVRDIRGCENTGALTVNVRAIPVAAIAITPDPTTTALCFDSPLQFDDASTVADGSQINWWEWNFNDSVPASSAQETPGYTYASPGSKDPTLRVRTIYGCTSPIVSRNIAIETLPAPSFIITDGVQLIDRRCEDINIYLDNTSTYVSRTGALDGLTYQWNFGDGNNSTLAEPSHAYLSAGVYDITLTATAPTLCSNDVTAQITINPEPVPNFTPMIAGVGVSEGCEGVYVDFQNTTTMPDGTGMTFNWDFADGTASTQVSPTKQYVNPSVYAVVLTATSVDYGCFESVTVNLTQHPAPKGTFNVADADICIPELAVLTNTSTVVYGTLTNEWNFGDGNIVINDLTQVTHNYSQAQQYKVTLTRTTDEGCTNEVSRNVNVHPTPVPSFIHVNACDGDEVVFYNNSVIQSQEAMTYSWNFGDASAPSAIDAPEHIFPSFGNYNVSLTATSSFGCSNQVNDQVTVYRNPSFDLGASLTACQTPFTIDPALDANAYLPGGSSFVWKNGQNQTLATSTDLQVAVSDVYSVTIATSSPEFCTSTVQVPVFLFKPVNLGNDIAACSSVLLDAELGLAGEKTRQNTTTAYQWYKDGVVVSSQQTLTAVESGVYTIELTRTVAGVSCSSVDEIHVQIDIPLAVTLPQHQTICDGETLILDPGVIANAYTWTRLNSGEEFTGPTLEVSQSGDYRLDVSTNGCTASAIATVVVSPGPSVSFGLPSLSACVGEQINITDYSFAAVGTISNRAWDFGDGTSDINPPAVSKTYGLPGTYSIELTATTDNGCTSNFTQEVVVHEKPLADFTIQNGCANADLAIVNNSTAGASFEWHFGDGTASTVASPLKSFEDDGQFTVTLIAQLNGCSSSVDHSVTVNPLPRLEFGEQVNTCGNAMLLDAENPGSLFRWFDPLNGNATLATTQQYFLNTNATIGLEVTNAFGCQVSDVTDVFLNVPVSISLGADRAVCDDELLDAGYLPGASYTWSSGETTRDLSVITSGFYQVDVVDQNGCAATASVTLTVNTTPVILPMTDQIICSGDDVVLDAGANATYSFLWSTGATSSSITASAAGNYTVTVSNQNCSTDGSAVITMNQSPVADFAPVNDCEDEALVFQNESAGAGPLQYLWNFGDGTFSAVAAPSKIYSDAGTFAVTLRVQDENGCSSQATKQIQIHALPTASFAISDGCTSTDLVVTNNSTFSGPGALSYQWNFGNLEQSSSEVPVYAYSTAGNYQVNLLVTTQQGCTDNFLQSVTIGSTPSIAAWITDLTSCEATVVLDAGNAGATYQWSDNATTQSISVSQSGQYAVVITAPDGCSTSATANVTLYSPAKPLLADQMEDCGTVQLDPVANAATYLWSTGDRTKTIDVSVSGMYSVQLITQNLCVSNDLTEAIVNEIPIIDLGGDRNSCVGETLTLEAQSTVPSAFAWSTGETTPTISLSQSGKYSVVLTSDKNCVFRDSVIATFHALPVITLGEQVSSCGPLTLDADNPGSSYLWSTGSTQQTINASTSGRYWIEVVNVNNCLAKDTVDVSILPVPQVDLGNDITLCNGQTTRLDAGLSGNQYIWSDNSTGRYLTAGATGTYQVAVTNASGCVGRDNVRVTVRPRLGLNLGSDRLLCSNAGQNLSAGLNNVSYLWGSTTGISSTSKTIKVERSGTYWVEIMDSFSCTAKDSVTVSPTTENITANFLAPTTVGQGDLVHFVQLSEPKPTTFQWTFGDGAVSNQENPIHRYFQTGDFIAQLVVSNSVCSDTLTKSITVRNGRVEVQPSPELPTLIDIVSAGLYPNPNKGMFRVDVTLTTEADVSVAVYSLTGITMDERRKKITHEIFEFDISKATDGVYLIRVIAEGKVRIFKVLKSGGL